MNDILKKPKASSVSLLYGKGSVEIESNGEIAGLEIDYLGAIQGVKKLPDGWNIKISKNKILIYSMAKKEITNLLFTYIGELEIQSCSYSDWEGNLKTAKVLNVNQDKWNINFGTFGSDGRKPEEIETEKIITRKINKSII